MKLKTFHPELSKAAAQFVYRKYQPVMERDTRELRELMVMLLHKGHRQQDLLTGLLTGEIEHFRKPPAGS